jgi:hypothetical protein
MSELKSGLVARPPAASGAKAVAALPSGATLEVAESPDTPSEGASAVSWLDASRTATKGSLNASLSSIAAARVAPGTCCPAVMPCFRARKSNSSSTFKFEDRFRLELVMVTRSRSPEAGHPEARRTETLRPKQVVPNRPRHKQIIITAYAGRRTSHLSFIRRAVPVSALPTGDCKTNAREAV